MSRLRICGAHRKKIEPWLPSYSREKIRTLKNEGCGTQLEADSSSRGGL